MFGSNARESSTKPANCQLLIPGCPMLVGCCIISKETLLNKRRHIQSGFD